MFYKKKQGIFEGYKKYYVRLKSPTAISYTIHVEMYRLLFSLDLEIKLPHVHKTTPEIQDSDHNGSRARGTTQSIHRLVPLARLPLWSESWISESTFVDSPETRIDRRTLTSAARTRPLKLSLMSGRWVIALNKHAIYMTKVPWKMAEIGDRLVWSIIDRFSLIVIYGNTVWSAWYICKVPLWST